MSSGVTQEKSGTLGVAPVARVEADSKAKLKIEVTQPAIGQVLKLVKKRLADGKTAPEGLRIGLRGGGCDGFSYVFEWADKPAATRDHVITMETGDADVPTVRIFIDPKSMIYLAGTTLNFVSGLMGHGFKFENPNVKGACGCGESVQF